MSTKKGGLGALGSDQPDRAVGARRGNPKHRAHGAALPAPASAAPRATWKARALAAERTVTVLKRKLEAIASGTDVCSIGSQLAAIERRANARAARAAIAIRAAEAKKHAEQFARHDTMCQDFMASLEEDVRAGTARIQAILDNVGAGLLLVGWDRKVAPGWSKSCAALLGNSNPTGMRLSEALGLVGGDAADFELGIEQILEDTLPEELTLAQARNRVSVGERTLGVTYGVVRKDGAVDAVLVTLTDMTGQMVAERAARLATALLEIRKRLPLFTMFVDESRRLLEEAKLAMVARDEAAVRRCVHTIKGNASVHDLVDVVRVAHEVESSAVLGVEGLNAVETALEAFLVEHRDVLGSLEDLDEANDEVRLVEADLRELIVQAGGDPALVAHALRTRHFVPAGTLVAAIESSAHRVASRLEKSVDVVVLGGHVALDARRLSGVLGGLTHLVRNAVDHGLERREERGTKPATGTLTLRFEDLNDRWRIFVSDDGRGIDPRRVAEAAAAKGLDVRPTSVEEAFDVLCMPGFSTADQVSDISGRGVGLSAVKEAVLELGGRMVVRSVPGVGTEFELSCPKAA